MNQKEIMDLKQILDNKCTCACHCIQSNDESHRYQRPTMAELHDLVETRQWKSVRRALRLDASVAMRIDDSFMEDYCFAAAREAAWHRHVGIPIREEACRETKEESLRCAREAYGRDLSSIRQRQTLLHSICKLDFYSVEESLDEETHGGGDVLLDCRNAVKTVEMIIDASHNELRPLDDDDYYEELEEGTNRNEIHKLISLSFSSTCRKCACYYQSQYCPPVDLGVVHESVLTVPDVMGNTPLHLLTGEGSAHIDMVRVFLDKCRTSNDTIANHDEPCFPGSKECHRPTLYDLLSAQNAHGRTPVHFLCGKKWLSDDSTGSEVFEQDKDAQVLRFILDRFQNKSKVSDQCCHRNRDEIPRIPLLHPLLISGNFGDIPLHYAASHGASASLLSMLTSYPGTSCASLVRNVEGRLPIHKLIIWYKELIDSDDENENENEDYSVEDDSSASSNDAAFVEWLVESASRQQSSRQDVDATNISVSTHFQCHLWGRMCALIQAGVNSITSAAKGTALFHLSPAIWNINGLPWNTISASVVLTKYFDFPALALVASILTTTAPSEALLKGDSFGLLPLHWACGNIARLLSSLVPYPVSTRNITMQCDDQPCSMIGYLLRLCPESARVPTRDGRLSLHLLLDGGYDERCEIQNASKQAYIWDDVKELLKAYPDALRMPDVDSHLYPFQVAAATGASSLQSDGERCADQQGTHGVEGARLTSLEITYRLIMEDPSLCRFIDIRHEAP